jgi:hypothetical protein
MVTLSPPRVAYRPKSVEQQQAASLRPRSPPCRVPLRGTPRQVARDFDQILAEIQETVLVCQGERGRPRTPLMLTEIGFTQSRLSGLFGLGSYSRRTE